MSEEYVFHRLVVMSVSHFYFILCIYSFVEEADSDWFFDLFFLGCSCWSQSRRSKIFCFTVLLCSTNSRTMLKFPFSSTFILFDWWRMSFMFSVWFYLLSSGMKGIRGDWKFSARAGCQSQEFQSRHLCAFVMDMVILAHSSLKVCFSMLSDNIGFSSCIFKNIVCIENVSFIMVFGCLFIGKLVIHCVKIGCGFDFEVS